VELALLAFACMTCAAGLSVAPRCRPVVQVRSSRAKPKLMLVRVDGHFGAQTIKAVQIMLKYFDVPDVGPADGRMGRRTTRALQGFLRSQGYDVGPVDGWWGVRSMAGMQRWLVAGGYMGAAGEGRVSIAALQTALNALANNGGAVPAAAVAAATGEAHVSMGTAMGTPVMTSALPVGSAPSGQASAMPVVMGEPVTS